MRLRRRFSSDARTAAADTEEVLVSALQESDSPAELLHDEITGDAAPEDDDDVPASPTRTGDLVTRRRTALAAGLLALLTMLVARRRRRG